MFTEQDQFWMRHAMMMAERAREQGEVPVGAVIVLNNELISAAFNRPISNNDPSAHAEILALREAAHKLNNYRLLNCELYVTLEPCMMCAGAMVHARIKRLVYGSYDLKAGAIVSSANLLDADFVNHRVAYQGGLFAEECARKLSDFFAERRKISRA